MSMNSAVKGSETISRFDFDQIADDYDSWYNTPVGEMVDRLEKRAVDEIVPLARRGERLLDVGCGTGHWSDHFTRRGYRVIGVDIAKKVLHQAVDKNISGATFFRADAGTLPFANDSFHVVAAITVLEFACDPGSILAEMARCTINGGLVMVGSLNRHSIMAVQRKLKSNPVFMNAVLLDYWQLRDLLGRIGQPRMIGSAFCLPYSRALPLSWLMEFIGENLFPFFGNFIVGSVRKWK